jgi:hypothetical protein
MKNPTPYLILLIAALSACRQPSKQPASLPAEPLKNHLPGYPGASHVIREYTRYLRTLDTTNLATSRMAENEFDSLFARQSPEVCDTGFMLFKNYQGFLDTGDSIARKFIYPVTLDTLAAAEYQGKKLGAQQQTAQQKLRDNNFIVQEEEGNPYIVMGWRLVTPHFSPFVSAPMKEILMAETNQQREGFLEDASLMIDASTLAGRTIFWERFLTRYPKHVYDSEARSRYNVLLYVLVSGADNVPVTLDDSPYTLTPYFDSAFHVIMDNSPDSRTNTVIKPFFEAIRARDSATMKHIRDSVPLF